MRFTTRLPPLDEHTVIHPSAAEGMVGKPLDVTWGKVTERANVLDAKVEEGALVVTFDLPDGEIAKRLKGIER